MPSYMGQLVQGLDRVNDPMHTIANITVNMPVAHSTRAMNAELYHSATEYF